MQVNARVDYALQAIIEIARAGAVVPRKTLTARHEIPARFLEQILAQLVRSGILVGTRGPQGGYELARAPDEISVADVVRAIDGPLAAVRGLPPEKLEYPGGADILRELWVALRASMRHVLEATTVADLAGGVLPDDVRDVLAEPDAWRRRGMPRD